MLGSGNPLTEGLQARLDQDAGPVLCDSGASVFLGFSSFSANFLHVSKVAQQPFQTS